MAANASWLSLADPVFCFSYVSADLDAHTHHYTVSSDQLAQISLINSMGGGYVMVTLTLSNTGRCAKRTSCWRPLLWLLCHALAKSGLRVDPSEQVYSIEAEKRAAEASSA